MIYYKANGDSDSSRLLVCIHGLTATHEMFTDFISELDMENLLIISPDLRGCGNSSEIEGKFTIDETVEDIKEILDSYPNRSIVLLGYSHGGTTAQLFARKYPDYISGLILCNTYAYNVATFTEMFEAYAMQVILHFFSLKTFSNLLTYTLKEEKQLSGNKIEGFRQMIRSNNKKAIIAYAKELITFDSRPWLKDIRLPCLIIRGQNDTAVPIHHTIMLSKAINRAKTIVMENAGHPMIWTHTKELAKLIRDNYYFLD